MNISIRLRLAACFATLAMLCAGQGAIAIGKASNARTELARFENILLPSIVAANKLQDAVSEVRIKEFRLFTLSSDRQGLATNTALYETARRTVNADIARLSAIPGASDRASFARCVTSWRRYETLSDQAFHIFAGEGRQRDALIDVGNNRPLFDMIREEVESLVADVNADGSHLIERSAAAAAGTVEIAWLFMSSAIGAALVALIICLREVSRPITLLTGYMKSLAAGDMSRRVPFLRRRDEIGAMAAAVDVFQASMVSNALLQTEAAKARDESVAQRRTGMLEVADHFERIMGNVVSGTAARATDMRVTAADLAAAAVETANRSATVATAAKDTAGSASSVADAAHALGQSVRTIYEKVETSSNLARVAASETSETEGLINDLVGSATKIGDIVSMISTIASQTNLLSLNAAIEAAAAGAGGRGFAVVALEVKALARQTSHATDEIAKLINHIQSSTGQTAEAIRRTASRITQISEHAAEIFASVGVQQATTRDIVQGIQTAAERAHAVTGNIHYVASAAGAAGTSARRVLDMASDLAGQSELLRGEVDRFLTEVRAA